MPVIDTQAISASIMNFVQQVKTTMQLVEQVKQQILMVKNTEVMVQNSVKSLQDFDPKSWNDIVEFLNSNSDRLVNIYDNAERIGVFTLKGKSYNAFELVPLLSSYEDEMARLSKLTPDDPEFYQAYYDLGLNSNFVKIAKATHDMTAHTDRELMAMYGDLKKYNDETAQALKKIRDNGTSGSEKAALDQIVAMNALQSQQLSDLYTQAVKRDAAEASAREQALQEKTTDEYRRKLYERVRAGRFDATDWANFLDLTEVTDAEQNME